MDSIQVWRLIFVDLDVLRTRPPVEVLHQLDPKVWRSLFPRWRIPTLLTPLSPSSKETQTRLPTRVTRGIQHLPKYSDKQTFTEEMSSKSSVNTAESYTPPESPPSTLHHRLVERKLRQGFIGGKRFKQPFGPNNNSPFQGYTNCFQITLFRDILL